MLGTEAALNFWLHRGKRTVGGALPLGLGERAGAGPAPVPARELEDPRGHDRAAAERDTATLTRVL